MRPRIRSLKPETWEDEKVGSVSRDARLLFVGLITMADDDGRFRYLPSAICGHVFPYDEDAPRKLGKWMKELETAGLILLYAVEKVTYGWLPGWGHQRINKKRDSDLPAPPPPVELPENYGSKT